MTYTDTLDYLYRQLPMFHRVGEIAIKKGLGNIVALCEHLQQPQDSYPCIHIAGTNGKGSTTHLIAAILQSAGYRVGVYVSPHYRDFRERIKINGEYISENEVTDFVQQHSAFFERLEPSFFEITVAMAFDHFRRHAVDIAVIETGLGGRLDSTNIITPILSVITNIDYDHQALLGNTLPEIAGEKAGIIKPRIPVVMGEEAEETRAVFIKKAAQEQAPLQFASRLLQAELLEHTPFKTIYNIREKEGGTMRYARLELGVGGIYQQHNLLTVLAAVHTLQQQYPNITDDHIRQGCAQVRSLTNMIGRWEVLQQKPLIIGDSAHNAHGFRYVVEQLRSIEYQQLHIVLGVVKDKDLDALFEILPTDALYYCCAPDIPRALDVFILQQRATEKGLRATAHASVAAALQAAKAAAEEEDLIYVGGSIFVLGEVI